MDGAARDDSVGGDDDTLPGLCALCSARSSVEIALVRAGVERITIVTDYKRTEKGKPPHETSKVILCLAGGVFARGDGGSREEAILRALEDAGVTL